MPIDETTGLEWHLEINDPDIAQRPDVRQWLQQCETLIDQQMKEQLQQPPCHDE